ncbi:putative MFS family arabinose efflux permease [Saccharopolyspora erythraea NRRL 2338]|uniref:Major facilitator superfamily (MFS) transporter n=2 Tax=Saccharopolyspora erythraea TaxID=1836 RepID=A4FF28_SACEN|nr:MFS transporter [Saccharopolyspora erythraea]EQD81753.1 major facilitator transporter [Saccharopolyspora erythraea D]PFG96378.1 putative MFS family arabinose efflux permease [Saccharopolyspora erythraea NRRL 2338]QRK92884.1 MFS transporter [Saccharopolyspora erythraea]CAM02653.1 major facilitator superfamily (MFS) transporter [Saccharopolyspora erythraea NRRL 2338]
MSAQPVTEREPVLIRSARDVTELVNSGAARGSHARMIVLLALGGIFLDAYDLTSLAYGITDIREQFQLGPAGAGAVTASISVGAIFGAWLGGYLVDRLGRYRVFMADMLFFVVSALGCAVAPNAEVLVFFRFLMGFGVGMDIPVAMAFLAEFSRLRGRGSKGSRTAAWSPAWYVATSACYVVIMALYFLLPDAHHDLLWRFTVGFGAVPAVVILLVRKKYMNESPSWAADQGDLERAAHILRRSYGVNAVVADDAEAKAPRTRQAGGLRDFARLFHRRYRSRTLQAMVIGLGQTFGYNAIAYGLPIIIASLLGQGALNTISASLVLNLVFAVTGGLLGIRLANSAGAWPMTVAGFATQFVALVALALIGKPSETAWVLAALFMLGAFMFAQASGPGAHFMSFASLSYPTSMRGTGIGFNQGVVRVGATLSLFFFPVLSSALATGVFWVIALAPAMGLAALLVKRWEPVGYDADAAQG